MNLKIDEIKFMDDLYPRDSFDNDAVNSYRLNIDNLPPIIVQKGEQILVDGYHRLMAHRIEGKETIDAEILDIQKDGILWEATKRNAKHGKQLNRNEKKKLGLKFYSDKKSIDKISEVLSVTERTIRKWTTDVRNDEKKDRDQQILALYLSCMSQKEISTKLQIDDGTTSKVLKKLKNGIVSKIQDSVPESLQIYNLWDFAQCDNQFGMDGYPGRIPGQIIENLLYYYTNPFDIVLDPMVGGGSTIDVCKSMYRRYKAYDINPIRNDIKMNDITDGIPESNESIDFILLDPPYGSMKKGEYTKIKTDLSMLSVAVFYDKVRNMARECKRILKKGKYLALIISNLRKNNNVYDLPFVCYNMFTKENMECVERIIVPYHGAKSDSGLWVNKAKESKFMLRAYRDLMIFKK